MLITVFVLTSESTFFHVDNLVLFLGKLLAHCKLQRIIFMLIKFAKS